MGVGLRRTVVLVLCLGFSFFVAAALRTGPDGSQRGIDFAAIYAASRATMRGRDPYNGQILLHEFQAAGGRMAQWPPKDAKDVLKTLTVDINLPTAFFAVAPVAALSWKVAQTVWLGLIFGLLTLAAFLVWDLGAGAAPSLSGWMTCFILLNCELVLVGENLAFVSVPLCVIAAWCFLEKRFQLAAVVLMALSLVMKPHDAGFVWLYFLLAGGSGRKRAMQTLAAAMIFAICAAVWIEPVSPHWMQELHSDLAAEAGGGGVNDPSPATGDISSWDPIISLQVAGSILKNDVHFYDAFSYAIGGGLLLAWVVAVWRKRGRTSREEALLALAAVSTLTMLPVYHRDHDAKLLLLAIPACAMLWARGGRRRWAAMAVTAAAVAATSDISARFWLKAVGGIGYVATGLAGKLWLLLLDPAPLVLLAAGCFYLWVYIRYEPEDAKESADDLKPAVAAAN